MRESRRTITKEEYDRLSALTYAEADKEITSKLSDTILIGYGYYGHRLCHDKQDYYLLLTIGNSCD